MDTFTFPVCPVSYSSPSPLSGKSVIEWTSILAAAKPRQRYLYTKVSRNHARFHAFRIHCSRRCIRVRADWCTSFDIGSAGPGNPYECPEAFWSFVSDSTAAYILPDFQMMNFRGRGGGIANLPIVAPFLLFPVFFFLFCDHIDLFIALDHRFNKLRIIFDLWILIKFRTRVNDNNYASSLRNVSSIWVGITIIDELTRGLLRC